jgi:hypothetical protein
VLPESSTKTPTRRGNGFAPARRSHDERDRRAVEFEPPRHWPGEAPGPLLDFRFARQAVSLTLTRFDRISFGQPE